MGGTTSTVLSRNIDGSRFKESELMIPNDWGRWLSDRGFSLMDPLEGAIESFNLLAEHYNTFILSTAPWNNPSAWSDKCLWVKKLTKG